jgi:2',3'-cyclic-nucleotide 2'-phosphodiesterase/3'-nucleotidase
MKLNKNVLLTGILSLSIAAQTYANITEKVIIQKGNQKETNEITINLLATSDIHGRLFNHEYAIDNEVKGAGIVKAASIIKEMRKKNPNLILIDVGDTVQDNSAELFNDMPVHPMVSALNDINYDVWVLGNHEFNFGQDFLKRNIKAFDRSVVTANIYNEKDKSNFLLPYQIFDVQGIKVAVIGITAPHIPLWEASAPEHFQGLVFEDPKDTVEKTLKSIEGQYDVLIGALHIARKDEYGKTGAFDIAKMYPQFDIIFAGHEHAKYNDEFKDEKTGKTTWVMEPGSGGWAVASGEIKMVKDGDKWKVADKKTEHILTENYTADPEIASKYQFVHEKSLADANQVIGKITETFIPNVDYITGNDKVTTMPTSQIMDNAVINLINEVQLYYTGADVSSSAIFDSNSNLKEGDFKKKDVAFIYKYTNTLMGVNMTGDALLKFMEWSAQYYNTAKEGDLTISFNPEVRGYNYDMFDGVTYEIDISKEPGNRIKNVKIKGEELDPNKIYKVAVNNYRFGTLKETLKLVTEEDKYYDSYELLQDNGRIREMIVDYIQNVKKGVISPTVDNNWKIVGIDLNVPGGAEILEKVKIGEITIPTSTDGRTPNVKSLNINEFKK